MTSFDEMLRSASLTLNADGLPDPIVVAGPVRPPPPPMSEGVAALLALIEKGTERAIEIKDSSAAELGATAARLLMLCIAEPVMRVAPAPPMPAHLRFGSPSDPILAGRHFDTRNNQGGMEFFDLLLHGVWTDRSPPTLDGLGQVVVVDVTAIAEPHGRAVVMAHLNRFRGAVVARTSADDGFIDHGLRAILTVNRSMTADELALVTAQVIADGRARGVDLVPGPQRFSVSASGRARLAGLPIGVDEIVEADRKLRGEENEDQTAAAE
jgi:hypothetical protein